MDKTLLNITINELEEISNNIKSYRKDGIEISQESISYAIMFLHRYATPQSGMPKPYIAVHPDGDIAFTWKQSINIAFNKNGIATWAAYDCRDGRKYKGKLNLIINN